MGNTLGITPYVSSMGLAGDCSLGNPWLCSMSNALGFHGLALGLVIGNSMGLLYGYAIVMPTCDSHGLPWLMLHKHTMDGPSV